MVVNLHEENHLIETEITAIFDFKYLLLTIFAWKFLVLHVFLKAEMTHDINSTVKISYHHPENYQIASASPGPRFS